MFKRILITLLFITACVSSGFCDERAGEVLPAFNEENLPLFNEMMRKTQEQSTGKSAWTQYCIPYLSETKKFSEIGIGTAGEALVVNSGATGYEWTSLVFKGGTGIINIYPYQNDALADDGSVDLADATSGIVLVSCNAEAFIGLVQASGTVTLLANTTNCAAADSDGNLCLFDTGTAARVRNRLNATGEIRIIYFYN